MGGVNAGGGAWRSGSARSAAWCGRLALSSLCPDDSTHLHRHFSSTYTATLPHASPSVPPTREVAATACSGPRSSGNTTPVHWSPLTPRAVPSATRQIFAKYLATTFHPAIREHTRRRPSVQQTGKEACLTEHWNVCSTGGGTEAGAGHSRRCRGASVGTLLGRNSLSPTPAASLGL